MREITETLTSIWLQFTTRLRDELGASMVEYGLLLALIAVVALGAFTLLGENVDSTVTDVAESVAPGEGGTS